MIRQILCRGCAVPYQKTQSTDAVWPYVEIRWTPLSLHVPAVCDICGCDVEGIGIAVTQRKADESDWKWEPDYGLELPPEALKMFDKLTL